MSLKLVEINAAHNLSTGNIMLQIAQTAREDGMEAYTFSKKTRTAKKTHIDNHYLIGSVFENTLNRYIAFYTDFQDVGSYFGTKKLVKKLKEIDPDVIHIHDIVGWYVNIKVLFKYFKECGKPIVWTFHDCWAFTGRCIYYDYVKCDAWKTGCAKCIQPEGYPTTKIFDHASWNYKRKKELFTSLDNLTIVTPSKWMKSQVKESFLKDFDCRVINNGVDKNVFKPTSSDFREKYNLQDKKIVLGICSCWGQVRKGYKYMVELSNKLDDSYQVVLVGVNEGEGYTVPDNIIGIHKTTNVEELVEIYSTADVLVDPTLEDNFPSTHIEALACGLPIVTFETGGAIETVNEKTGKIVPQKNIYVLQAAVEQVCNSDIDYKTNCLEESAKYDKKEKYQEYISLLKEKAGKEKTNG